MDYRVTIPKPIYADIRAHLLRGEDEEVALLFGHETALTNATVVTIQRWEPVPPQMLVLQRPDVFAVDSAFIVSRVKMARTRNESLFLAHSHPGDPRTPCFSRADDRGEADIYPLLRTRLPGRVHGALVMSPGGCTSRMCLPNGDVVPVDEIRVVGRHIERVVRSKPRNQSDEAHARQQLIWGSHGQGVLRDTTIGIVGAGGTGSVVAQQLIHLGVRNLIVVDKDTVEESNLARIVGARRGDIGMTPKVDVVSRTAHSVDPTICVTALHKDVTQPDVLNMLREADILFGCTDQHYSRMVLNALAVQHVIPFVDLGFLIDIHPESQRVISAVGEVRIIVPGGYCLSCAGVLDAERIKAEKASPEERAAFPRYFTGLDVPDPSVITLNSVIASLAVSVGVDMLVPTMRAVGPCDSYRFNALKGIVNPVLKERHPECGICGAEGRAAFGAALPMPR